MIVPIRLYGDPSLKEEAYDVEDGDNVVELVQDLFDTLESSGSGVGLAATQIGVPLSVFVVTHKDFKSEFINPVIIKSSSESEREEEGCLSIPNVGIKVERSKEITVRYSVLGEDGKLVEKTEDFDGYLARIIQHENDHLDGISITDKIRGVEKKLVQSKLDVIIKGNKQYRYPTLHRKYPLYQKVDQEIKGKYYTE